MVNTLGTLLDLKEFIFSCVLIVMVDNVFGGAQDVCGHQPGQSG